MTDDNAKDIYYIPNVMLEVVKTDISWQQTEACDFSQKIVLQQWPSKARVTTYDLNFRVVQFMSGI